MKILHLTESAYPWRTGGKEIFAFNLAGNLNLMGIENVILIHQTEKNEPVGETTISDIKTVVLPPVVIYDKRLSSFSHEVDDFPGFKEFLLKFKPDIIHFHDQSGGASLSHLRYIKQNTRIKTIVTYHTPGQSCPQRALLYHNKQICDGKLLEFRCTECQLNYLGVPKPFNYIAAKKFAHNFSMFSNDKIKTAIQFRGLTKMFIDSFNEFYREIDAVQIHADWVKNILVMNGVEERKINKVNLGGSEKSHVSGAVKFPERNELRLVFTGRCTYIKGVHILINAIKMIDSSIPIEVYFFGPYWDDSIYGRKMRQLIGNDPRFKSPELISNDQLQTRLREMDICVIPSVWLETGPLNLYNAWDAGLPVIGSNLGGLKERIVDGKNGFLFTAGNSKALADKIRCIQNGEINIKTIFNNIGEYSSFKDTTTGILSIYKSLLN